jgi:hypothetical protein
VVPRRDQAVLWAARRVISRRAGGNSATSGSRVSRISLINFNLGFQCSGSRGSSKPGDLIRSATDLVP